MHHSTINNLLLFYCRFKIAAERELVFSKDYEQRAKAQVKHSQSNIINMTQWVLFKTKRYFELKMTGNAIFW